jgi:hypothetical protein
VKLFRTWLKDQPRHYAVYQLCRYITRPAIANERLKLNSTGD